MKRHTSSRETRLSVPSNLEIKSKIMDELKIAFRKVLCAQNFVKCFRYKCRNGITVILCLIKQFVCRGVPFDVMRALAAVHEKSGRRIFRYYIKSPRAIL